MEIVLDNRQTRIAFDPDDLKTKAERLLEGLGCSPSSILSISIVNAEEMAELNCTFRGKSQATNVLSFSQKEGEAAGPDNDLLGDVVICADRASQDALELSYTTDEMIFYLLVHGALHLIGYTHDQPRDDAEMAQRVERIFKDFFPDSD